MSQYSNILKRQKYNEVAFAHFSMRSLPKNKHNINSFLGQLPKECLPTIMAISETKLNPANVNTVKIEDYQSEHIDSLFFAGGVGIYIRKDIQYSVKPEISIDCPDCENLFIEVITSINKFLSKPNSNKKQRTRSLIIGVLYRHPSGSYETFQERLSKILRKFSHSNQAFILMGDYNIDLFEQNTNNKVTNYLNELYSVGCYSLINKSIRITVTSATTLDRIYSNSLHKMCVSGLLISDISDHLPTFCIMTSNIQKNLTPKLMIRASEI